MKKGSHEAAYTDWMCGVNTEICNAKGLNDWRLWLPKWNSSSSPVLTEFALTRNRLIRNNMRTSEQWFICMMYIINEALDHHVLWCHCVLWLPVNEDGFIILPFHLSPYQDLNWTVFRIPVYHEFVPLYCSRICSCLFSALCHFFLSVHYILKTTKMPYFGRMTI